MKRKIVIRAASPADWPVLRRIWQDSVAATHHFISKDDLHAIGDALIPSYFPAMHHIWIAETAGHTAQGFIGIRERCIEMLFVTPAAFRCGIGSALLRHACAALLQGTDPVYLDVNEANTAALLFYQTQGFTVVGRSPIDSDGRPYPLLHMQKH